MFTIHAASGRLSISELLKGADGTLLRIKCGFPQDDLEQAWLRPYLVAEELDLRDDDDVFMLMAQFDYTLTQDSHLHVVHISGCETEEHNGWCLVIDANNRHSDKVSLTAIPTIKHDDERLLKLMEKIRQRIERKKAA